MNSAGPIPYNVTVLDFPLSGSRAVTWMRSDLGRSVLNAVTSFMGITLIGYRGVFQEVSANNYYIVESNTSL